MKYSCFTKITIHYSARQGVWHHICPSKVQFSQTWEFCNLQEIQKRTVERRSRSRQWMDSLAVLLRVLQRHVRCSRVDLDHPANQWGGGWVQEARRGQSSVYFWVFWHFPSDRRKCCLRHSWRKTWSLQLWQQSGTAILGLCNWYQVLEIIYKTKKIKMSLKEFRWWIWTHLEMKCLEIPKSFSPTTTASPTS